MPLISKTLWQLHSVRALRPEHLSSICRDSPPGLLYTLGAESIGYIWIPGGYPGSRDFAKAVLARTSCEKIAPAWVLLEPNGPMAIPDASALMADFGARLVENYSKVGIWQTAPGAGGFQEPRAQVLYKPIAVDAVLRACQTLR